MALSSGRLNERDLGVFRVPGGRSWAGGDYGPNSAEVERLLAALEALDPPGWAHLVAVNDAASRNHPPEPTPDSDYRRALLVASEIAIKIAMTAVGPESADAWRTAAATAMRARLGNAAPVVRDDQWRLADRAWRYQFAAQHAVLSIATANAMRWAIYGPHFTSPRSGPP